MPQEWLTTGQAAELLGISRSTATRYAEQGLLETRRLPSGHLRISRASAQRLLRQIEDDERKR
jgi:excisionase family DNA binding protein